jgi:hypothetical protein
MMRAFGPDDLPRIKIVKEAHPSVSNFKRTHVQVFLGRCFPEDYPLEDFPVGGWTVRYTADELRPPE